MVIKTKSEQKYDASAFSILIPLSLSPRLSPAAHQRHDFHAVAVAQDRRAGAAAAARLPDSASTATCGCVTPNSREQLGDGAARGDFAGLSVDLNRSSVHSFDLPATRFVADEGGAELLHVERLEFAVLRLAGGLHASSSRESCTPRPGRCSLRPRTQCYWQTGSCSRRAAC